jgi:hypothetical protein
MRRVLAAFRQREESPEVEEEDEDRGGDETEDQSLIKRKNGKGKGANKGKSWSSRSHRPLRFYFPWFADRRILQARRRRKSEHSM